MSFETYIALALAMFVLAVTPGPGMFATIARALHGGFRPALSMIAGIVTGAFNDCESGAERDVTEVLADVFADAPYPVVTGLPCGHATPNTLLPIGLNAELDGRNGVLMLVEPATRAAC